MLQQTAGWGEEGGGGGGGGHNHSQVMALQGDFTRKIEAQQNT